MNVYWTELNAWRETFAPMTDSEQVATFKARAERELRQKPITSEEIDRLEAQIAAADGRLWELRYGHLPQDTREYDGYCFQCGYHEDEHDDGRCPVQCPDCDGRGLIWEGDDEGFDLDAFACATCGGHGCIAAKMAA